MGLADIQRLTADAKAIREEIRRMAKEEGSSIIMEVFANLWEYGINGASWTQYTPYFNDGDSCEFGVNPDIQVRVPGVNVEEEEDMDGEGEWIDAYSLRYKFGPFDEQRYRRYGYTNQRVTQARDEHAATQARLVAAGLTPENVNTLYETTKAISDFLSDNEELCEAAFGDHVRVIVTPSGVEVEDYDHD